MADPVTTSVQGNFRLSYVALKPGELDGTLVEKDITAISLDDARDQAEAIYKGEPEGTLIDDLKLVQIGPMLGSEF